MKSSIVRCGKSVAIPFLIPRSEVGQVINLMDALRQSVEQAAKKPEPVRKNGRKKVDLAA